MSMPNPQSIRYRQGRDYHITVNAKDDYIERFTARIEGLDSPAIYGRISKEITKAQPVEVDADLLERLGYEDRRTPYLCASDPNEEACTDPVYIRRDSNITAILTPAEYRDRIRRAMALGPPPPVTLGDRFAQAGLLISPQPSATPSSNGHRPISTMQTPPDSDVLSVNLVAPPNDPKAESPLVGGGRAVVTLAISSEQAMALFAQLMREGCGAIGEGPIVVELSIRK